MVWRMVSYHGPWGLYIIPRVRTLKAAPYAEDIVGKAAKSAVTQRETISLSEQTLYVRHVEGQFEQDSDLTHRARRMQVWCRSHFSEFWAKDEWSGNSPTRHESNIGGRSSRKKWTRVALGSPRSLADAVRTDWSHIGSSMLDSLH